MGTYLIIKLKNRSKANVKAEKLNKMWIDFADEEEEKEYEQNFYSMKCGYTLHFNTKKDILDSARFFILRERWDLGFRPSMTAEQMIQQYEKIFPSYWIGSCQIKLSGSHFCYHTLEKVKNFLELPEVSKIVEYDDEDGALDEYIAQKEQVITSRYCKVCKEIADRIGIKLPIYHGEDHKNAMYSDEYNKLIEKVKTAI